MNGCLSRTLKVGLVGAGSLFVAPAWALSAEAIIPRHRHALTGGQTSVVLFYCTAIVAASVLGGYLPKLVSLTHERMQMLVSYVGGLMLGISVFHLLPHSLVELGGQHVDASMLSLMIGMVIMFLLLRMFHFHDHGAAEVSEPVVAPPHRHDHDHDGGGCAPELVSLTLTPEPPLACAHSHDHGHIHGPQSLGWVGVCFGLSVHSLLDGIALGASVQAGAHSAASIWVGFGTFLAIILHKPLDSVSIAVLMRQGKCPSNLRSIVNLLYSLMCPLGALIFLMGLSRWTGQHPEVVGYTLAFAAGVFLCISLSDLLPEMEFHSHHRVPLTIMLLAGILTAWAIRWAEDDNAHEVSVARRPAIEFRP